MDASRNSAIDVLLDYAGHRKGVGVQFDLRVVFAGGVLTEKDSIWSSIKEFLCISSAEECHFRGVLRAPDLFQGATKDKLSDEGWLGGDGPGGIAIDDDFTLLGCCRGVSLYLLLVKRCSYQLFHGPEACPMW